MPLLVGLGNPGANYAHNRHNVGFLAADKIADCYSFPPFRRKFHGLYCEGTVGTTKLSILKPQTFMNDSGQSVAEAANFYKFPLSKIFVVHDEIDLRPGKVRAKQGGSSAGHNGLRSIDDYLGADYWRIRIGVGRPEPGGDVIGYVLRNFTREDKTWLPETLSAVADALPLLLAGDAELFMTKVAAAAPPPKADAAESDNGV
jgi:PTH1 family peptidyl-tRNA hydrolase